MEAKKLENRLRIMLITIVFLLFGLTFTSLALADSVVRVQNNRFQMSSGLSIKINDGAPVVDVTDIVYEPGGTYRSEFPISNKSNFAIWYKIYFTDVQGELNDYITVTVKEADGKVLCKGKMSELGSNKASVGTLDANEEKTIYIEFYFLPDSGNSAQGKSVSFNIAATSTQKENNPNKDFGD